ncbi:MAG: lipid A biosynthesis acyltransferase, partial [Acidobacteria bacterium]
LNTTQFNRVIERMIRQYPDQWLWVHKRWATRPPGEPDLYDTT